MTGIVVHANKHRGNSHMKQSDHAVHEIVGAHLSECKKYIDADIYGKALSAVKDAKFTDPHNIYIIALEKQIKLLADLVKSKPTATSYKNEIKGTLPEIIRRSIEDSKNRVSDKASGVQSAPPVHETDPYTRERDLALKKLKNQFIKLAEEFIDRGDYQSALEEIRRIFIIEPENAIARDLEKKIETLIQYRKKDPPARPKSPRKRRWGFSSFAPPAIALLVLANVLIFYITATDDDDDQVYTGRTTVAQSGILLTDVSGLSVDIPHDPIPVNIASDSGDASDPGDPADDTGEPEDATDLAERLHEATADTGSRNTAVESDLDEIDKDGATGGYAEAVPEATAMRDGSRDGGGLVLVDEPMTVRHLEQPVYPAAAIEQEIEGNVVVRVLVDSAGSVTDTSVETSDHPLLTDSALESARLSQFSPTLSGENNEAGWISIPYRYRIVR
jgi:TonB family protein